MAVSLWLVGCDLWQVIVNGRIWTGTDGIYITDQMQYLAWVESASQHLLVANLFVIHGTSADYLQPAIAISGGLTALGLAPTLALLLWKPVAVIALFLAVRAYASEALRSSGRYARLAVIALALFYGSFSLVYGHFGVVGDLFPGFLSWGYPFALLGVAAAVFAQLAYGRARLESRFSWWPGVLGALASSMHPWQGEVFLLILVGVELTDRRLRVVLWAARRGLFSPRTALGSPRLRLFLVTVGLTLLPLVYYAALDKFDPSWGLGRDASKHAFPFSAIALALAPLALVALLSLRRPDRSFVGRAVWLWPLAAVIVYFQSGSTAGATPLHAFDGITLPLAVLAVDGVVGARSWRRIPRRRWLGMALVAAATIPTTYYEMEQARIAALPTAGNANFITSGESQALNYLRHDPTPGGVLTRFYLGSAVPARTGRHTYVGDCIWSEPNCTGRSVMSRQLLFGQMTAVQALQFVKSTHARFVLSDCTARANLTTALRPILVSVRRFGCATVYQVSS